MFDIENGRKARAREDEGVTVQLKDETGKIVEDAHVVVVGSFSETYRQNIESHRQKVRDEQKELTDDEARIALAACSIKSWSGIVDNGEELPCTTENAIVLLTNCPWVMAEIGGKAFDHSGFFTKPSAS